MAVEDESIQRTIQDLNESLKKLCRSKTSVPVDQVYPLFTALSDSFKIKSDLLLIRSKKRDVILTLEDSARSFKVEIAPLLVALSDAFKMDIEVEVHADDIIAVDSLQGAVELALINKHVQILTPKNVEDYYSVPLELGGFSLCSLGLRDGLVEHGNKNLGLVKYHGKVYSFSSWPTLQDFCRNLEKISTLASKHPSYIMLLHLSSSLPSIIGLNVSSSVPNSLNALQSSSGVSIETQVDLHPPFTFDRNYKWNEWELRRNAIMQTNLRNKITKSSQTNLSNYRVDIDTQVYLPKDQTGQTRKDQKSNTIKRAQYYAGIRYATRDGVRIKRNLYGLKESKFKVLSLTLDLD